MDIDFKIYQKLMPYRVRDILIVSSPYDAFIMEEDGGMLDHVFLQYRGISIVEPPRFTVKSDFFDALEILEQKKFDLVVVMPRILTDENLIEFGRQVKKKKKIPIVLLLHSVLGLELKDVEFPQDAIDRVFVWTGNRSIMWTILKWREDLENVVHDNKTALVQVIIYVEDSPYHYSSLLPLLYRIVLDQTQALMHETLNEEHRLLKLRARPKILLASNYEEALDYYSKFKSSVIGVFSDTTFLKNGLYTPGAGIALLDALLKMDVHLPVLVLGTSKQSQELALKNFLPYLDKGVTDLHNEIKNFIMNNMGFGDFVFKNKKGKEIARANNLLTLEQKLTDVPIESISYHVSRNHFSKWLFARTEIMLALKLRPQKITEKFSAEEMRQYLIDSLLANRIIKQKGVVSNYGTIPFEEENSFLKIGDGSLGGKARGLAFFSRYLALKGEFLKKHGINIKIPSTLVVTTDFFDQFLEENNLSNFVSEGKNNSEISRIFLDAKLPVNLTSELSRFLENVNTPIAVRSSGLREDYGDLTENYYKTYFLANTENSLEIRLDQLSNAIKLIYGSLHFDQAKMSMKKNLGRVEDERMAIIVQKVVGNCYEKFYYPAISGHCASFNFYPLKYMKAEDGIANIHIGLGNSEGIQKILLRFCPKFPQNIPQFASIDDIISKSQKDIYVLNVETSGVEKVPVIEIAHQVPVKFCSSFYTHQDHKLSDYPEEGFDSYGNKKFSYPIITYNKILKYNLLKLPELLDDLLALGKSGFGCDIDIEFALNINANEPLDVDFYLLQARPIINRYDDIFISILDIEIDSAFLYSKDVLGTGKKEGIKHLVFVPPEIFSQKNALEIVQEISLINKKLVEEGKEYLLIGPGRWGTSDHCLGIPVDWSDISNAATIVEVGTKDFRPDPSHGTHFFQNITSKHVIYLSVAHNHGHIDYQWLETQSRTGVNIYKYVQIFTLEDEKTFTVKVDSKLNQAIITVVDV